MFFFADNRLGNLNLQSVDFMSVALIVLVSYKYTFVGRLVGGCLDGAEGCGAVGEGVRSDRCSQNWCFDPRCIILKGTFYVLSEGTACLWDYY